MPNDENKNPQPTPENDGSSTEESTAGDILEQLKADAASTANLYKLEMKLFKTVTNVDKTLTKEYKMVTQIKNKLDNIGTSVVSMDRNVGTINTAISSVDTNLKRIVTLLERAQNGRFDNSNNGTLSSQNSTTPSSSTSDDNRLAEIERILAEVTGNYGSVRNPLEEDLKKLIERYKNDDISEESFKIFLTTLQSFIDAQNDVLEQARRDWKDDGTFRFANDGQRQRRETEQEYDDRFRQLTDMYRAQIPDENGHVMSDDEYSDAIRQLAGERNDALSSIDSLISVEQSLDKFISDFSSGRTYNARTGENHTAAAAMSTLGEIGGQLGGEAVGAAIGTAIGGPAGTIIGGIIGDVVGSKIEALGDLIGDRLDYLANHSKKTRDEILQAGMDKIRNDVKDMATYSIEIYESSTKALYDAWDKNLGQVTATQGYTKEALNTLQDSVAQRLQEEGYGTTINASEYLDQLSNTLNANLGGKLAEAFAAQNLILQKAVPEVDLSTSAAQFAAIYTNANRQGRNGEEEMISAMNEIAGAAKALEEVTDGNNQFLKETSNLLSKATEVVNIAGGNADQISGLTTQMMASEAAITSLSPQLSGFTSELVGILMNNNDATAVSLRAIMNDLNSNIGVSATSFMQSFMEDTKGTLSTAFAAIQRFIDQNENEASRQEFLKAMESVFGVSGSKLAQIDFGSVSEQIAQVNTSTNMAALTDAENLVRSGETTTLEEQLVANTSNQLLATNAISATLDNKLMRKLEANELSMEKVVYSLQATQSVELAENTLGFFTKISDLLMSILDPFGLLDGLMTSVNAATSAAIDAERYMVTSTMSSIGSAVADSSAGAANVLANTIGGATAVMAAAQTKSTDAMVLAVEAAGVSPTFEHMMLDYSFASKEAQEVAAARSAESNAVSYAAMEQQSRQSSEYQQKQEEAMQQDARYEEDKAAAREQQRAAQEAEDIRNLENHDNIVIIKDAIEGLDMSEYLSPILDEHRTHTEQIKELQTQTVEIVRLLSTVLEYKIATSSEFASTISFDEKARIMNNGYVGGLNNGYMASLF